jgi:beta-lactamase regulating signal transducer with metallopeptidase domain
MLWWLAQNAVVAAALAGVVALACRVGRLRPAVRHALWLVVLLKLVTPPIVSWPWPGLPSAPLATAPAARPVEDSILVAAPQTPPPAAEEVWLLPAPDVAPLLVDTPPPAPRAATWSWPAMLVALAGSLWLTGTVLVTARELLRIVRFRLQVGRGRPAPRALVEEMEEVADRLHLAPPELVVLPNLASPMVWGLGRAQLLWPARLLEGLPAAGQRAVLAHELAHLKRRDHWVGWLQLAAACLWWWYPLFWFVRGQLRREAELACDAWVVALLPQARRAYAEALLEVARIGSRVAVPAPVLGVVGRRRDFTRRLTMIMREGGPCRVSAWNVLAVVLLALIVLPAWSLGQPAPQPKTEPTPAAPAPQPAQAGPTPTALDYGYPVTKQPATEPTRPVKPASGEDNLPAPAVAQFTPPAQPGATPASADRDRRLRELEDKLEALLREIKDLRGGSPTASTPLPAAGPKVPSIPAPGTVTAPNPFVDGKAWTPAPARPREENPNATVTLSRATYKLPKDKAEALSTFLRDHVKASVVETKVEGENIIVTTTPEAQHVIGQFVALIEGKLFSFQHAAPVSTPAYTPAPNAVK